MNPAIYVVLVGIVITWCGQLSAFRAGLEHEKSNTKTMGEESRKYDARGMILLHLGIAICLGGLAYGMWG